MLENFKVIKLWIDDVRTPPDHTWTWAKSSAEALDWIDCVDVAIEEVSFDHDLGGDDTAMNFIDEIEELAYENSLPRFTWHVHSANPVGRANIIRAMESVERYWRRAE